MPNLLLVDDSLVDRELAGRILQGDASISIQTADNGRDALAQLKESEFDVVVSDMQMPELDGLQLVTTMRVEHPEIPVILMTAHGSETIALEALEHGAANYVPKNQLRDRLLDIVHDTLGMVQANRAYTQLLRCFNTTQFDLSLENDRDLVEPLVDYIVQLSSGMGICDGTGAFRIGNAVREALSNAIVRGNLEITVEQIEEQREKMLEGVQVDLFDQRRQQLPYSDRKVHLNVTVSRDELRIIIRDEGPGFDVSSLPASGDNAVSGDSNGRGLILMRTFMDEVTFNNHGNEVTLIKRR